MFAIATGNLLETDADALVNAVNCEGVMGKGIALQFRKAFPKNYEAYVRACRDGEVRPGRMFVFETGNTLTPKYIINFPTKRRWREKSRMVDIETGLEALVSDVRRLGIMSMAIPALGCGLGGLMWEEIRPRVERACAKIGDVRVTLFEPDSGRAGGRA